MEIKVIEEIDNLLNLIEQYQLKGVVAQVNSLKELKYIISNHIELSTREKMNIHYSLFLPRGGLSELYYMDATDKAKSEQETAESVFVIVRFSRL